MLATAFRAGSDQWDNPRYRATYAGLQVCLVAWAWVEHRRAGDPWLRRSLLGIVAVLAWFLPWYLRRYYSFPWEISDPFKTLGLGLISLTLIALWDWARTLRLEPVSPQEGEIELRGNVELRSEDPSEPPATG
jgi:hypothetical protein